MFGTVNLSSSRNTLFLGLIFITSVSSCSNKPASNSDCHYDIVTTHAEITNMKPHPDGNGRIAVIMDFKASVLALEDQELGELKEVAIDHDYIVRNKLEIGLKYEVNVSQITKGDCTPQFVSFNHDLR